MLKNDNIRIKDIAKLAGVSVGTVDRVIHKRGKVSAKALEKVMAVLDKTDYKPNLLARTLGNNKTFYIAVLTPHPSSDEYWYQCNKGIESFLQEWEQYNVIVKPFYFDLYNKSSFKQSAQAAIDSKPDGVLAAPVFYREAIEAFKVLADKHIEYALFNTNIPETKPLTFIGQDLYQSGKLAAELLDLLCQGQTTYTMLHISENVIDSYHLSEKERGFKDYFESKANAVCKTINIDSNEGADMDEELHVIFGDPNTSGLITTTAMSTRTAATFLSKHDKKQVKLVGYDLVSENIEFLRNGYIQFLIHQNPQRQANLGLNYLANHLLFKKDTPHHDFLPLEIISRQNLDSYIGSSY